MRASVPSRSQAHRERYPPTGRLEPYAATSRDHYRRRTTSRADVPRLRVALLITCFNDTLFPGEGRAVVELLERLGCEVAFPEEQTCCGQMHGNTGYRDQALDGVLTGWRW